MSFKCLDRSFLSQFADMYAHVGGAGRELCAALPVYIEGGSRVECKLLLALASQRVPDYRRLYEIERQRLSSVK